ncbi:SDR family NAD(P)-dependent oxidoreductase [Congregibacter variabilis]|uniref:SDR family NAD(P)-dependent oxidoreductase n=1 Tax=Congregibacter variabilis TaxID=3081200 RepID=A0ABZ0I826_9GAMM|nr:SDR family NAD(P)-dependent oxidoreductase [Congregibacter sp. IMCC43200]
MSEAGGAIQGLVVGAGGGIGSAIAQRWSTDSRFDTVWAVSREVSVDPASPAPLRHLATDHSEGQIAELAQTIMRESPRLSRVVIALGTLHGPDYAPEKSLDALQLASMQEVHRINCILPMLWISALVAGLRKSPDCRIAVLSARVGSIGDNRLGGWYSYRSAKAALNMGLRCASIELARRAKGVKLISFHPGTVDTALSAPFQRGVPEGKLFDPDFVARRLEGLLDAHSADGELSYLDWAGEPIPW